MDYQLTSFGRDRYNTDAEGAIRSESLRQMDHKRIYRLVGNQLNLERG